MDEERLLEKIRVAIKEEVRIAVKEEVRQAIKEHVDPRFDKLERDVDAIKTNFVRLETKVDTLSDKMDKGFMSNEEKLSQIIRMTAANRRDIEVHSDILERHDCKIDVLNKRQLEQETKIAKLKD